MVPVEAQACGTPVVALGAGGACETVEHGVTGMLVAEELGRAAFAAALDACRRTRFDLDESDPRANAERFSRERFLTRFPAVVVGRGAIAARGAVAS